VEPSAGADCKLPRTPGGRRVRAQYTAPIGAEQGMARRDEWKKPMRISSGF